MQSSDRGSQENVLDTYFATLKKLKENVSKLFENYFHLLNEKIDCDSGKLLYSYTKPLCTAIAEALNRVDELEILLHNIDSWFELPVVQPSYQSGDLDRVSDDAHELIEIVKQFQSALRSVVTPKEMGDAAAGQSDSHVSSNYSTDDKLAAFSRSVDFPPPGGVTSPKQFLQQQQQRLPSDPSGQHPGYLTNEAGYLQDVPDSVVSTHQPDASERVGDSFSVTFANPLASENYPPFLPTQSRQIVRGKANERIMESTGMEFEESPAYLPPGQKVNQLVQEQATFELQNPKKLTRTPGHIQYTSGGMPLSGTLTTPANISPSCYQYPKGTSDDYN